MLPDPAAGRNIPYRRRPVDAPEQGAPMRCEHCGRTVGDATPPCPHCPAVHADNTPAGTDAGRDTPRTVIDPEVVDERESGGERQFFSRTTRESGGTRYTFASWNVNGNRGSGGFVGGGSCLPGCITLFMPVLCAVQFGVLAAVGFLFFYMIGSGIAIFAGLQRVMQGRTLNPWIPRVINWGVSWLLAGWLSGGF